HHASLKNADLRGANLAGANFQETTLLRAKIDDTKGLNDDMWESLFKRTKH
ncbi:MAG: pentapeptide repeat-containing protein, partial [Burkholderiales bacterium]